MLLKKLLVEGVDATCGYLLNERNLIALENIVSKVVLDATEKCWKQGNFLN
jgi:hypothetical protein